MRFNVRDGQHATMSRPCALTVVIPQFTGTCWFNAILMILTTGTMREIVKRQVGLKEVKMINEVLSQYAVNEAKASDLLKGILSLIKSSPSDFSYMTFFASVTPENLLSVLHTERAKKFSYDPVTMRPGGRHFYLIRLLEMLQIEFLNIFLIQEPAHGQYSLPKFGIRDDSGTYSFNQPPPANCKVLLVQTYQGILPEEYVSGELFELGNVVVFHHVEYICESLYLPDYKARSHAIAGITCDGRRRVYDGNLQRPGQPCPLFAVDWWQDSGFCLNYSTCAVLSEALYSGSVQDRKRATPRACFNRTKSGQVVYVYVRKDIVLEHRVKLARQSNRNSTGNSSNNTGASGADVVTTLPYQPMSETHPSMGPSIYGPAWFCVLMAGLYESWWICAVIAQNALSSSLDDDAMARRRLYARQLLGLSKHGFLHGRKAVYRRLLRENTQMSSGPESVIRVLNALGLQAPEVHSVVGYHRKGPNGMIGLDLVQPAASPSTAGRTPYLITITSRDANAEANSRSAAAPRRLLPLHTPVLVRGTTTYHLCVVVFHEYNNHLHATAQGAAKNWDFEVNGTHDNCVYRAGHTTDVYVLCQGKLHWTPVPVNQPDAEVSSMYAQWAAEPRGEAWPQEASYLAAEITASFRDKQIKARMTQVTSAQASLEAKRKLLSILPTPSATDSSAAKTRMNKSMRSVRKHTAQVQTALAQLMDARSQAAQAHAEAARAQSAFQRVPASLPRANPNQAELGRLQLHSRHMQESFKGWGLPAGTGRQSSRL